MDHKKDDTFAVIVVHACVKQPKECHPPGGLKVLAEDFQAAHKKIKTLPYTPCKPLGIITIAGHDIYLDDLADDAARAESGYDNDLDRFVGRGCMGPYRTKEDAMNAWRERSARLQILTQAGYKLSQFAVPLIPKNK